MIELELSFQNFPTSLLLLTALAQDGLFLLKIKVCSINTNTNLT